MVSNIILEIVAREMKSKAILVEIGEWRNLHTPAIIQQIPVRV